MKQNFQGIGHQAMKDNDPQLMRNKWTEPFSFPNLLPKKSFQTTEQGLGTQVQPGNRSVLKRQSWESRKAQECKVSGQRTKEERTIQSENPRGLSVDG